MSLWTPAQLDSLFSWWKADAITGLSDDDRIATWVDSAGDNDATAVGDARPTYKTGIQNGLPVTRWSGTNTLLLGETDLFRNVSGGTLFAVKKDAATSTRGEVIHIAIGTSGSTRAVIESGGSGGATKHEAGGRRLDANSYARALGSAAVDAACRIVCGVFDYANSDLYLYLDGVQDGSNTSFQTNGSTSDTATSVLGTFIGSSTPTANHFNGDIAEIIVFHAALAAADRQQVEGYLAHKWGLAGNLWSDHPYKKYPPGYRGIPVVGANLWRSGQPRTRGIIRRG